MNTQQQLFSIFYAVLYGAMLTSLGGLRAFQWGFPAEVNGKLRLVWRLFVSILCLNVAPFLVFATGYSVLACSSGNTITYWKVFCISAASLSVYAPYRLYHVIMIGLKGTCIAIYNEKEYREIVDARKIRESEFGHMLALLFYCGLFLLLLGL